MKTKPLADRLAERKQPNEHPDSEFMAENDLVEGKYKPLVIQVPEPSLLGECNQSCSAFANNIVGCKEGHSILVRIDESYMTWSKPGPGCPWFDGGEDE